MSAAAAAVAGAGVAAISLGLRYHVAEACTPGSCAPRAPRLCRAISRLLIRTFVFLQVGPVSVKVPGYRLPWSQPFVFAANHGHYADGLVLAVALQFPTEMYGFVARGALAWAGGLGALGLAAVNTVCVDLRRGYGVGAFRTGVRLLKDGKALLVFPEGWAHMDGRRGVLKNGAVAMAQKAAALRAEAVFLVPASIQYPKHPGAWITTCPPAWQYAITLLAFPMYRRGATVTIGTPIDVRDLPPDAAEATRVLESAIDECLSVA